MGLWMAAAALAGLGAAGSGCLWLDGSLPDAVKRCMPETLILVCGGGELEERREAIKQALQEWEGRLEERCDALAARAARLPLPHRVRIALAWLCRWWILGSAAIALVFALSAGLVRTREGPAAAVAGYCIQSLMLTGIVASAWIWEAVDPGGRGVSMSLWEDVVCTGVPLHFDIPCNLALGLLPLHLACLMRLLDDPVDQDCCALGPTWWSLGTGLPVAAVCAAWLVGWDAPWYWFAGFFCVYLIGVLGLWVFLLAFCLTVFLAVAQVRALRLPLLLPGLLVVGTWLWALLDHKTELFPLLLIQWSPLVTAFGGLVYALFRARGTRSERQDRRA